jgi:ubiquitin C-terminal hydrolase
MTESKSSVPIKHKLIGDIVYSGTADKGHYVAYVKNENDFQEFDVNEKKQLDDEATLEKLKAGACMLAYERE